MLMRVYCRENVQCLDAVEQASADVFTHYLSISIRFCNCSYSRCSDLMVSKDECLIGDICIVAINTLTSS